MSQVESIPQKKTCILLIGIFVYWYLCKGICTFLFLVVLFEKFSQVFYVQTNHFIFNFFNFFGRLYSAKFNYNSFVRLVKLFVYNNLEVEN